MGDCVQKLLTVNQEQRASPSKALEHKWIAQKAPQADEKELDAEAFESLRSFCGHNKLKRAALHAIARRLSEDEIKELKAFFTKLDVNKDGVVTFDELQNGITKVGTETTFDAAAMLKEMDINETSSIDYTEFLAASLTKRQYQEDSVLWSAFCAFDQDHSGSIDKKELAQVIQLEEVKEVMGSQRLDSVMAESDASGDGKIDFKEFKALMTAQAK